MMISNNAIGGRVRAAVFVLTIVAAAAIAACSPSGPTTPAEGSAEREAIFEGMRKGRENPDVTFVVRTMKVQDNWAWVVAEPQSKDGSAHFETESWLLQKTAAGWQIAAQPCAEEGCEPAAELAKIRQNNPQAPAAIFAP